MNDLDDSEQLRKLIEWHGERAANGHARQSDRIGAVEGEMRKLTQQLDQLDRWISELKGRIYDIESKGVSR